MDIEHLRRLMGGGVVSPSGNTRINAPSSSGIWAEVIDSAPQKGQELAVEVELLDTFDTLFDADRVLHPAKLFIGRGEEFNIVQVTFRNNEFQIVEDKLTEANVVHSGARVRSASQLADIIYRRARDVQSYIHAHGPGVQYGMDYALAHLELAVKMAIEKLTREDFDKIREIALAKAYDDIGRQEGKHL